ncbi:MAG: TlpA family protein disulfide reductase [Actinobacteria bacterium]|nr:TlpA family protein disulfide reductase [Actinomycetota bacterium]
MDNRKKGIIILIIVAILIVVVFALGFLFIQNILSKFSEFPSIMGTKSIETGIEAPNFTLKNLNGEDVELSQIKGNIVLIDFWAVWCKPCVGKLPYIQSIHEKYGEESLVVLAINVSEKEEKIKSFIEENNYTFPVLIGNKTVSNDYGAHAIPFVVLIDKEGTIRYTELGYRQGSEQKLINEIEKLLEETSK